MKEYDTKKHSDTNWQRIKALQDHEVDFSHDPELETEFFEQAVLWQGKHTSLQLRNEILEISRRCAALPDLARRSPDEILDYC